MTENISTNNEYQKTAEIYQDGTYLKNNQSWHAEDSAWKAKHIKNILDTNTIYPKTFCEIGCGAGEIIKELSLQYQNSCFDGFELSPQAFEICKKKEAVHVKYYFKNLLMENNHYDCLLCIDVFEHVDDYLGFIKGLKPKAEYKIFHIPLDLSVFSILTNLTIKARESIGHIHYFTRETALATLRDCDYIIIDSFYTTSFIDMPSRTLKGKLAKLPYRFFFWLSPCLTVRILGGSALMVLAK